MALSYLTYSANDGHLSYRSKNLFLGSRDLAAAPLSWGDQFDYSLTSYPFHTLPMTLSIRSLYSPVVNSKQDVRVYYADDTQTGVPRAASSIALSSRLSKSSRTERLVSLRTLVFV